jgi:hypothetical protein
MGKIKGILKPLLIEAKHYHNFEFWFETNFELP